MPGTKTNERPGTRAQVKFARMSAYKAREVLDLIRGLDVQRADEVLKFSERDAAIVIRKCLASAIANAVHNDEQPEDELYVSSCYADEGVTIKRWRPRARGRATRIRKRTCHITVIVSRMDAEQLERRRERESARPGSRAARRAGQQQADRARRVARSRRAQASEDQEAAEAEAEAPVAPSEEIVEDAEAAEEAGAVDQQAAEAEAPAELASVEEPEAETAPDADTEPEPEAAEPEAAEPEADTEPEAPEEKNE
jgi:large subunit ribosomal protein L22